MCIYVFIYLYGYRKLLENMYMIKLIFSLWSQRGEWREGSEWWILLCSSLCDWSQCPHYAFMVWKDTPTELNSWFSLKCAYNSYKYGTRLSFLWKRKKNLFSQLIQYKSNSWYWALSRFMKSPKLLGNLQRQAMLPLRAF